MQLCLIEFLYSKQDDTPRFPTAADAFIDDVKIEFGAYRI